MDRAAIQRADDKVVAKIARRRRKLEKEMESELSGEQGGDIQYCAQLQAALVQARSALEAIESLTDEEIGVRFRTSSHKTEEQMAGKSVIYSILSVCRNMARAGLGRANTQHAQKSPDDR